MRVRGAAIDRMRGPDAWPGCAAGWATAVVCGEVRVGSDAVVYRPWSGTCGWLRRMASPVHHRPVPRPSPYLPGSRASLGVAAHRRPGRWARTCRDRRVPRTARQRHSCGRREATVLHLINVERDKVGLRADPEGQPHPRRGRGAIAGHGRPGLLRPPGPRRQMALGPPQRRPHRLVHGGRDHRLEHVVAGRAVRRDGHRPVDALTRVTRRRS